VPPRPKIPGKNAPGEPNCVVPQRPGNRPPGKGVGGLEGCRSIDLVAGRPLLSTAEPPDTGKSPYAVQHECRDNGDGGRQDVVTGLFDSDNEKRPEEVDRQREWERDGQGRPRVPRCVPIPRPRPNAIHAGRLNGLPAKRIDSELRRLVAIRRLVPRGRTPHAEHQSHRPVARRARGRRMPGPSKEPDRLGRSGSRSTRPRCSDKRPAYDCRRKTHVVNYSCQVARVPLTIARKSQCDPHWAFERSYYASRLCRGAFHDRTGRPCCLVFVLLVAGAAPQ